MTPSPILNPTERDALYRSILVRLTGIDDVLTVIGRGDFEDADRVCREFSALLRLLPELGWGDEGSEVVLTTPPDVLYCALVPLKKRAESQLREDVEERDEIDARRRSNQTVLDICVKQMAELEARGHTQVSG